MKVTKTFLIKIVKHQIQVIKDILSKGVKAFKSYVLRLVDLENQLEELTVALPLPELKGTEKQVAWANDIRVKVLNLVENAQAICYESAKKEVIKREGYADFFMDLDKYIHENKKQVTTNLGEEQAERYFNALRENNKEIEELTQDRVARNLAKLNGVKMQTGLSRVDRLKTLSDSCVWITCFKSVTMDWDSYISILSTLRGDSFA
jgi:hypothetical protein